MSLKERKMRLKRFKRWLESSEILLKDWKIQVYRSFHLRLFLLVLLSSLILTLPMIKLQREYFKLGEPAPRDVIAPRTISIPDDEITEKEFLRKLKEIKGVYKENPEANESMREKLNDLLVTLDHLREREATYSFFQRKLPSLKLSKEEYNYILALPEDKWNLFKYKAEKTLEYLLTYHWKPEEVYTDRREELLKKRLIPKLMELENTLEGGILLKVMDYVLEPNVKLDEESLRKRIQELKRATGKLRVRIEKGKYIIRRGEIVTKFHLKVLRKLGYVHPSPWEEIPRKLPLTFTLSVITALILSLSLTGELYPTSPSIDNKLERALILTYALFIMSFGLARLLGDISPFLIPVAFTSIILVLLLGYLEGSLLGLLLTFFLPFLKEDITFYQLFLLSLEVLLASLLTVFVRKRWDFLKVTLIGLITISLTSITLHQVIPSSQLSLRDLAYVNGGFLLSVIISMGLLPFIENILNFTSPIKLIDLMNPRHPLLHRLSTEAPGTYSHSLMVANLAEQAAEAINADSLLCRVGAYYHDIGKIKRPEYFVENQYGGVNPHDNLNPRISAIYIISHVRDGVELAKEYNLPPSVIDFIRTHHGTSLVYYFYHKAKSLGMNVTEAEFRYPGPKPFTKETAILMLADSIEASARTLSNYDVNTLKDLIEEIVKMKIEDEQLQNAPLTLSELEKIKDAFLKTLISTYHKRIRYPNQKVR